MPSPTGRLHPMEPEAQFLPIKRSPQEEEYLQGRSSIARAYHALCLGITVEEYNKRFIENSPDFSKIERRIFEETLAPHEDA